VDTCGISDTGPDTYNPPAYAGENATLAANEMFNQCSPSAQVEFAVTFQMPFQRSATAQQYEFELVIYQGTTRVSHTRVIIENPALSVADFYRDYDSTTVCPSGTHVVWGNFTYSALCPTDGSVPFSSAQDYSQIRFCGETATSADASFKLVPNGVSDQPFNLTNSANGGCAPGEVLLGIATANPDPSGTTGPGVQSGGFYNTCPASGTPGMGYSCAPTTPSTATAAAWGACTANTTSATCAAATAGCTWNAQTGFNVGAVLQASGVARDAGLASDRYLRIRMEFDPSAPSDAVAPWLYSWNLDVDCIPSE